MDNALRCAHVAEVIERLRRWLDCNGYVGIVLRQPGGVAWATGGINKSATRRSSQI